MRPDVGHRTHLKDTLDLSVDLRIGQLIGSFPCVERHSMHSDPEWLDMPAKEHPQDDLTGKSLSH
jgi:hypothetical protein